MYASILILTDNDERDLPGCLQSVRWSDDVHVLDSFSGDRTVEIASKFEAQVTQRKSDGQAAQLNAALDTIPFKYPWLLVLAPDERVTQGLEAELRIMYYHLGSEVAYQVRQREVVWGRPLKRSRAEACPIRYFSWDSVRFHGSDPVVAEVSGPVGRLEAAIDHHPLAKGFDCWIAEANRLTTREAEGLEAPAACGTPVPGDSEFHPAGRGPAGIPRWQRRDRLCVPPFVPRVPGGHEAVGATRDRRKKKPSQIPA